MTKKEADKTLLSRPDWATAVHFTDVTCRSSEWLFLGDQAGFGYVQKVAPRIPNDFNNSWNCIVWIAWECEVGTRVFYTEMSQFPAMSTFHFL